MTGRGPLEALPPHTISPEVPSCNASLCLDIVQPLGRRPLDQNGSLEGLEIGVGGGHLTHQFVWEEGEREGIHQPCWW